jgi:hypothetical protein
MCAVYTCRMNRGLKADGSDGAAQQSAKRHD